ncbi:MAG TPA: hypothetical protein VFQ12_00500 [Thermoleophilaceae bacterium]|nr:hypothetical protein [Thermoleophilaceae bacterium]
MGRRSRKRGDTTRAERDAARRERAAAPAAAPRGRPGRPGMAERPPAPWGSLPLSELLVLLGIVLIVWGFVRGSDGQEVLAAGLVIASLGGGELALREHLGGYRSHSSLLAGVATFVSVTVLVVTAGPVALWVLLVVGVGVFGGTFYAMRELFRRRSGGLGFR